MDKRVAGLALLAVLVGFAVLFTEIWMVGWLASMTGPVPHGITRAELEWRGLGHSLFLTWGLPSALGALLIASFKPRRWALYGICAILPAAAYLITTMVSDADMGVSDGYGLLSGAVNMVLIPLFLGLYYALIRRHTTV